MIPLLYPPELPRREAPHIGDGPYGVKPRRRPSPVLAAGADFLGCGGSSHHPAVARHRRALPPGPARLRLSARIIPAPRSRLRPRREELQKPVAALNAVWPRPAPRRLPAATDRAS